MDIGRCRVSTFGLALQRNELTAPDRIPKHNGSFEARPTDLTELKAQIIDALRLTSIGRLILIHSIVLKWGVTTWQRIILPLTESEPHRFVAKPFGLDCRPGKPQANRVPTP